MVGLTLNTKNKIMKTNFSLWFIILGICALLFAALIGLLSSIVYIYPEFLKSILPFNQLRPLHTTSAVSWIILTATGGLYFYISKIEKIKLFSVHFGKLHLALFIVTGIGILYSLFSGKMGGREYLEFFPLLTIPILIGWILFGLNYFLSLIKTVKNWPVYYWMWGTGLIFMVYHLSEAHFWIFNEIRGDFIKDLTIQWKSYGSFVGSWNLLVYGTVIYLMSKIKGDDSIGRGKTAFFFYFLGLTNLMFGWAHHTYIIPTQPWIRYLAYAVSMTEWIIFIHIVYNWSKSISKEKKKFNFLTYKFIIASEIWVFLNLTLALFMSIPTFNYFMHGTHITVGHSMGTTIGINTTILFASISYIISKLYNTNPLNNNKIVKIGFYIFNISLLLFWLVLIIGGIYKAIWMTDIENNNFSNLQESSNFIYNLFSISGGILFTSLLMITIPMLKKLTFYSLKNNR